MSAATTWQDLLHPGRATDFFSRQIFPPFDPEATSGYNRANALWLAELSRLVYRHDIEEENPPRQPTRTGFLEKSGFRQRRFFISQNTQAMLVESVAAPLFAVLVFRGTENIQDVMTDLKTGLPLLDQNTIGVHPGFRKALDIVWNDIDDELAMLACPVFYTGHSLGAALATLAALRRAPRALYTFASPRVGNEAFVASFGSLPIFRIVDDEDALTRLPPEALGFRHAGTLQLLVDPNADSFQSWPDLSAPPKPLADHAPVNYVDRI